MSSPVGKRRSSTSFAAAIACGTILITGSAASSHTSRPHLLTAVRPVSRSGTVAGIAAPCVGVAKPRQATVIVFARRGGEIVTSRQVVWKPPGGSYRLSLQPGTYVVSAPRSHLTSRTIRVQAGRTVTANFNPSCD
jgi:hypothetical protein